MNSIARWILVAFVASAAFGCGKKDQKKEDPTPVETTTQKAEEPSSSKEAEGEARDALLALQRVHFEFDSSELTQESRDALTEAATNLKALKGVELYVDGHADSAGTTEYNLQLGEQRAVAVKKFLARLGVDPATLHVVSFGEEKPLEEGSEVNAKNRRVEFRLMEGDIELVIKESAVE